MKHMPCSITDDRSFEIGGDYGDDEDRAYDEDRAKRCDDLPDDPIAPICDIDAINWSSKQ